MLAIAMAMVGCWSDDDVVQPNECEQETDFWLDVFSAACEAQRGCEVCECVNRGNYPEFEETQTGNNEFRIEYLGCINFSKIAEADARCEGKELMDARECLDNKAECERKYEDDINLFIESACN